MHSVAFAGGGAPPLSSEPQLSPPHALYPAFRPIFSAFRFRFSWPFFYSAWAGVLFAPPASFPPSSPRSLRAFSLALLFPRARCVVVRRVMALEGCSALAGTEAEVSLPLLLSRRAFLRAASARLPALAMSQHSATLIPSSLALPRRRSAHVRDLLPRARLYIGSHGVCASAVEQPVRLDSIHILWTQRACRGVLRTARHTSASHVAVPHGCVFRTISPLDDPRAMIGQMFRVRLRRAFPFRSFSQDGLGHSRSSSKVETSLYAQHAAWKRSLETARFFFPYAFRCVSFHFDCGRLYPLSSKVEPSSPTTHGASSNMF